MKIFTRSIALLSIAFGVLSAQAQYDLQVNGISTFQTSTGNIPPAVPIRVMVDIENTGPDIPDQSTFLVFAIVNGDTLGTLQWTFVNGNYPNGATGTVYTDDIILPAAPPTITLCGAAVLEFLAETSYTNNAVCEGHTVSSSAVADLSARSVYINAPTGLDGFDIDNGDNQPGTISDLNAVFKNEGNVTLPAGYGIPYEYHFYDADGNELAPAAGALGVLQADLAPGDSSVRPSVDPQFTVPAVEGTYYVCVNLTAGFGTSTNDTICRGFEIIDSYIPPPPVGINEAVVGDLDIYYLNGFVWVKNVSEQLDVVLSDMQGKVVATKTFNEDGSISTQNLSAGVYFLQTSDADGNVNIQKFAID